MFLTKLGQNKPRGLRAFAALCLLGLLGCAHSRGTLHTRTLAETGLSAPAILAELAGNHRHIHSFRGTGAIVVSAPKLGKRRFQGRIAFRKPGDLYVRGDHSLGTKLFEMVCDGHRWVIVLPEKNEWYAYQEQRDSARASSTPPALVIPKEIFAMNDWAAGEPSNVKVSRYSPQEGSATLTFRDCEGLKRRIKVKGYPWKITESVLFTQKSRKLVTVKLENYRPFDGYLFPTTIKARFPISNVRLSIELRNVRVNPQDVDDSTFRLGEG